MLKDYEIPYVEINGDIMSVDKIVDDILDALDYKTN